MTMTPEERAVIQAAIADYEQHAIASMDLREATRTLIFSCPDCNRGGHTCPGDGKSIKHGDTDCGEHDDEPAGRPSIDTWRQVKDNGDDAEAWLAALFLETGGEWLNYAEWPDGSQVKIMHMGDSVARVIADSGRGNVIGEFHMTASAKKLPPTGPEDDGALRAELRDIEAAKAQEPIWVPATWADVRTGDDVRLPGTENYAHVHRAVHLHWHVDPRTGTSSYNPPQALEWSGVAVTLYTIKADANGMYHPDTGVQTSEFTMDPAKPIEIKTTQLELDAINLLGGWPARVGIISEQDNAQKGTP